MFFGEYQSDNVTPGSFWTYDPGTGLSVILSGVVNPGQQAIAAHPSNGRVYFGTNTAAQDIVQSIWTWHEDTGLTTIANLVDLGADAIGLAPDGTVYFGQDISTGGFWAWKAEPPSIGIKRGSTTGALANQPLNFEQQNAAYTAATQASDGEFFLVNGGGQTLDRYVYKSGASRFELASQLPLGVWAGNVKAVVTDQAYDDVALLDSVGKKIYAYPDRRAESGSPVVYDISAIATTPTGLAINGRTGEYLVIDSSQSGSAGNETIKLHVLALNAGAAVLKKSYTLKIGANHVTSKHISTSAAAETSFRIQFDDGKNILYLISPTLDRVFAMNLPGYK